MAGIRERVRAELTSEIVRLARGQVAADGPGALSLRAIARDLGMASSAIYRYFPSRDHLLTQLLIDSYDRLGDVAEAADAACPRADPMGRRRAVAHAIRGWAVANPSEYALLFGTPVPGYMAPEDTIGPASRYTLVLIGILADQEAAGARYKGPVPAPLAADLTACCASSSASPSATRRWRSGWAPGPRSMGAITLELFGHLHNVVDTPGALFDAVVEHHAAVLAGLPGT